jgi:hypothetical protein
MGSEVECESIYSSASALALARYRASLPSIDNVSTNTGYDHELGRMNSTTSFSSASSLARHRISQRHSLSFSSKTNSAPSPIIREAGQSVPMSTTTTNTEDMALVWQPDPESTGSDPAANLWMEIEARLNRGKVGVGEGVAMRDERGQWVLTRQRKRQVQDRQVVSQSEVDDGGSDRDKSEDDDGREQEQEYGNEKWMRSEEMKKQSSDFTVSAYFDPDLSTPIAPPSSYHSRSSSLSSFHDSGGERGTEGTAIFNMAAPLVTSIYNPGSEGGISATPANTPLIHYETIQRVSRVRKSYSSSTSTSRSGSTRMSAVSSIGMAGPRFRGRSDSSSAVVDLDQRRVPESIPMVECNTTDLEGHRNGLESRMIRLDSHVQAALEVLSDNPDSPGSITLDIDIQAQSSYLGTHQDGEDGISPYTELDETTPMPIPIPYQHTPTPSHAGYQSRPNVPEYPYPNPTTLDVEEIGLGMGMNLHLDSIYSLPVLSPRLVHRATSSTSTSEGSSTSSSMEPMSTDRDTTLSSRGESQDSYHYHYHHQDQDQDEKGCLHYPKDDEYRERLDQEEEEEMLTVTDLDTGHRVDLSIKRLDELWRI